MNISLKLKDLINAANKIASSYVLYDSLEKIVE
jgi:hypothetical protein